MNKAIFEKNNLEEGLHKVIAKGDMRSEYDFSKGVRGKHYQAYRQGHQVRIHQSDGSVVVQNFKPEKGAIFLEPDVQIYFSTSEAVNNALRGLIALIPKKTEKTRETV